MSDELVVVNNVAPLVRVEAQRTALSKLFHLKPATLELVSKSTHQEGAKPGTFRVTSTNEKFEEVRAVILFEPQEQRELYRKGEFNKDAKLCFSLDNVTPHKMARDPKALYCEACEFGDKNWAKYRDAQQKGVKGLELSNMVPPCRKYWHIFLADRHTKMPYYFNVKGLSVRPFEQGMQNVARLFQLIINNTKLEQKKVAAYNAANPSGEQMPMPQLPQSVSDVIWQISFTMYVTQPEKGGQFVLGLKDFSVMKEDDYKEFGSIIQDIAARRAAGRVQSQVESEAEAAAADASVTETPASTAASEVAAKNALINI
jgi:hypothetical protein